MKRPDTARVAFRIDATGQIVNGEGRIEWLTPQLGRATVTGPVLNQKVLVVCLFDGEAALTLPCGDMTSLVLGQAVLALAMSVEQRLKALEAMAAAEKAEQVANGG